MKERSTSESDLLTALVQREGGFASSIQTEWTDGDEPPLIVATIKLGDASGLRSGISISLDTRPPIYGSGIGLGLEDATIPALAESIERYSTAIFYEDQFTWSSSDSLHERVLDLDTIPKCSETERRDPHCLLSLPSKCDPIRWVKGLSLHDGEPILVPVVMVYSYAGWRSTQERFWLPISTGCAAHRSYQNAVLSALCEVIERDAISVVWLQQLPLPRIVVDEVGPLTAPYWALFERASSDIEYHFFDATSDAGVPTVYGVQISRHHPHARTIVACATALTFDEAIAKVMKDFATLKRAFVSKRAVPLDTRTFTGLLDGATYMASPERAAAFDFLLNSVRSVSLRYLSSQRQPLKSLSEILNHLKALKMQAIAVDLTTDEAIRSGLRVVRVLIPELQPLSLHTAAQFLAHSRLYTAPGRMGYVAKDEPSLNKWPQPFA
jgi:ribosomal protein S12 methylthiotransferase accessory factor